MQFGMGRVIGPGALLFAGALASPAGADDGVATALVVSVVVSGSVVE